MENTATQISDTDGNTLSLSLPQKEGKAGYLTSFLIARNEIIHIIKSIQGKYDARLIYAVKVLIGFVDEDAYRRELYKRFNDRIREINETRDTTAEAKAEAIMDEATFIIGEITSYFDRVVGLSHKLEARLL